MGQRAFFDDGIENYPGGRDVDGVQRVCGVLRWGEIALESFCGVPVYIGGGGVYVFAEAFVTEPRYLGCHEFLIF